MWTQHDLNQFQLSDDQFSGRFQFLICLLHSVMGQHHWQNVRLRLFAQLSGHDIDRPGHVWCTQLQVPSHGTMM